MVGDRIIKAVKKEIVPYEDSTLKGLVDQYGQFVIKFVSSHWALHYVTPKKLRVSDKPALTWGTATYVTPLAFPLSSALYGRVGVVSDYDPAGWQIFDATQPAARTAYINWTRAQAAYQDLLLTVHSTHSNHLLRDQFRKDFKIDCVLFYPDQEAEFHTNISQHIWMAVTDWTSFDEIDSSMSTRFKNARFSVLLDEDFELRSEDEMPIRKALRQIECATEILHRTQPVRPVGVSIARANANLPTKIANAYSAGGYLHLFIEP